MPLHPFMDFMACSTANFTYRTHYVAKLFILWLSQRCFLRLRIHNVYTQYQYNEALYTYVKLRRLCGKYPAILVISRTGRVALM